MHFFDVVEARRSIRSFAAQDVDRQQLRQILEAASLAPSAGNLQAYEIVIVRDVGRRQALAAAAQDQEFVGAAPLALVFCAHPARSATRYRQRGERLYSVQDATIACTFAVLAATALGLGSVWVGAFDEAAVGAALQLPREWLPVAILPVGHPAERPAASSRRDLADLVHER